MSKRLNVNKDKNNVDTELFPLPKGTLDYKKTGTKATKGLQTPSKIRLLGSNMRRRLLRTVLPRVSVEQLDNALEQKIGKKPNRSEIIRHGHRMFHEGVQAGIEKGKELKLKEIKQQLKGGE